MTAARQVEELKHLTQRAVAYLLGHHPRWVRQNGVPSNHDGEYDGGVVHKWQLEQKVEAAAAGTIDPLMMGPDTPMLEQLRGEQYRKEKRKNDLEEGQLVDAMEVRTALATVGQVFRTKAEAITKAFGDEVGEAIREMIEEATVDLMEIVIEREEEEEE